MSMPPNIRFRISAFSMAFRESFWYADEKRCPENSKFYILPVVFCNVSRYPLFFPSCSLKKPDFIKYFSFIGSMKKLTLRRCFSRFFDKALCCFRTWTVPPISSVSFHGVLSSTILGLSPPDTYSSDFLRPLAFFSHKYPRVLLHGHPLARLASPW